MADSKYQIPDPDLEGDELYTSFNYEEETAKLLQGMSRANKDRVFKYEMCELDYDFVGFLHSYKDLADKLPKDFTIIDIGANQAVQSEYFKDFDRYIAVEPFTPEHAMAMQFNMDAYTMTGQEFIRDVLPKLQEAGLDLNKTFCVSSYVPDVPLRDELIPQTFPYYRSTYAGCHTHERLPEPELSKDNPKFIALVQMLDKAADSGVIQRDPNDAHRILVYRTGLDAELYGRTEGFVSQSVNEAAQELKSSLMRYDNEGFESLKEALSSKGLTPQFTDSGDFEGLIKGKSKGVER